MDGISGGGGSSAEVFDWGAYDDAIDFSTLLPQPSPREPRPCQNGSAATNPATISTGSADSASSRWPPDKLEDPRPACTKGLTDLLLEMDKIWARLPLKTTLHIPRHDPHELYIKALTEKATARYILENLFTLAQQLIDLYPQATALIFSRDAGPRAPCDVPDCTHELALPPALCDLEGQSSGQNGASKVDAVLANVLVACHVRLLDVLDRVFLLVTSCTRVTLASPDRREPELEVSEVRVGSFVPQRSAAVLMHMTLLKHLMLGLSGKLALLNEELVVARTGGGFEEDLDAQILKLQYESLARRHARQIENIGTIEEFLLHFDPNNI
ncbi:Transcription factor ACEII [Cytospora mali]|uniref:Transcription factor ACEII n=1 Tax=Cytospora mali TaxID=578113 RepID=A0A194W2Q4_CYTMA|nr:Transcription factor ACEII [Valsa mali]